MFSWSVVASPRLLLTFCTLSFNAFAEFWLSDFKIMLLYPSWVVKCTSDSAKCAVCVAPPFL